MNKRRERSWMYDRFDGRYLKTDFVNGVQEFLEFAVQKPRCMDNDKIRCPCMRCNNKQFLDVDTVKEHLYKKGFLHNYFEWISHGEDIRNPRAGEQSNPYQDMIVDALGHIEQNISQDEQQPYDGQEPNDEAKKFFELLKAAEEPLFEGSKMSVLEMASRITSLKCEYNLPHRCVDGFASLLGEVMPNDNLMSRTFYDTKKVLKGLELPHEKIHTCRNGCMLFWRTDAHLVKCTVCGADRYKKTSKGNLIPFKVLTYFPITPRLQRLYQTKNISKDMTWHTKNHGVNGTMTHPSDSESWNLGRVHSWKL